MSSKSSNPLSAFAPRKLHSRSIKDALNDLYFIGYILYYINDLLLSLYDCDLMNSLIVFSVQRDNSLAAIASSYTFLK